MSGRPCSRRHRRAGSCWPVGIDQRSSVMIRGGGSTARSSRWHGQVRRSWSQSKEEDPLFGRLVKQHDRPRLRDIGVDFDAEPGGIGADMNVGTMVQASYGAGWSSDFAIKFVVSQHLLSWRTLYAPQLSGSSLHRPGVLGPVPLG